MIRFVKHLGLLLLLLVSSMQTVASELTIRADGLFETGALLVTMPASITKRAKLSDHTASAKIKGLGDRTYRSLGQLSRIDKNNFAGNIFHLKPGSTYSVVVDVSGFQPVETTLTTQPEFEMPPLNCDTTVDAKGLRRAVDKYSPQAERKSVQICVSGGTSNRGIEISHVIASRNKPFIIRAVPGASPVIDARGEYGFKIDHSSNVWIEGFTIAGLESEGEDLAKGFHVDTARGLVIRKNIIKGATRWGILLNRSFKFIKDAGVENDINLIEYNTCEGQYNCFQFDNNGISYSQLGLFGTSYVGGHGLVVRYNRFSGGFDAMRMCGDEESEGGARQIPEDVEHTLAQTGSGKWTTYNIAVHDNLVSDTGDDLIETDGICVALKVFRNRLRGKSQNSISVAPVNPGPVHYIGNALVVEPKQSFVKLNTAGDKRALTRNVFIYNNVMLRSGDGPLINSWYGKPGDHNVPIKNVQFINNVIASAGKGRAIDISVGAAAIENPLFDYNAWLTAYKTSYGGKFEWWDLQGQKMISLNSFKDLQALGVEKHGLFGNPHLTNKLIPKSGSPLIDAGAFIPGITDNYSGKAPDIGLSDLW